MAENQHDASYCEDPECDRWACRKPHLQRLIAPDEIASWGALNYWCDVYMLTESRGVPASPWFFCWMRKFSPADRALLDQALQAIFALAWYRLDPPRNPNHWTEAEPVRMWAERVGLLGAQAHVQRLAYIVMM